VILIADHRLFLNRMMCLRDSQNVEFAWQLVSALAQRQDDGPPRDKLLFVEFGQESSHFEVPLKEDLPLPHDPLGILAAAVQHFANMFPQWQRDLVEAERKDELDGRVRKFFGSTNVLLRGFQIGSVLLIIYGIIRITGPGRFRLASTTPSLPHV